MALRYFTVCILWFHKLYTFVFLYRIWEVVGRTTKGPQDQDCVAVVAIVSRSGHPDAMVLIKQFRPPLKSYTIEMPAGIAYSLCEIDFYLWDFIDIYMQYRSYTLDSG